MHRSIAAAVLLATASCAGAGNAVTIDRGACGADVRLVARGVPLTEVLTSLASALDFELRLAAPTSSLVDIDAARPAAELVARLSPSDNIVVMQGRDPACPGRTRILKVWLLGKGSALRASEQGTPRPMSEAERRQIQENEELYRKAHGMGPAGSD